MKKNYKWFILFLCIVAGIPAVSRAQQQSFIQINAAQLLPHVEVSFAPKSGTFVEGSTFQVPILIDTKGTSINGIDLKISFDASRLSIVQPSNGKSIIGVWIEPPTYDNTRGTASFVGVIPNGINASSGLVGTITFVAKKPGKALVSYRSNSSVLVNDGQGSNAQVTFIRAEYDIIAKPPEGVRIYSNTHPSQEVWYNNNSPTFAWEAEKGVSGFSYVLDTKPSTVPDAAVLTTDTVGSFENLADGLYYFHVRALKNTAWGTASVFAVRIDTTPPASFRPQVEYVVGTKSNARRALLTFFSTDRLSGIDHYEVGVIDKKQKATEAPVFVTTESPYQIPLTETDDFRVIVRAIDVAGNVRDESVDVQFPSTLGYFLTEYLTHILVGTLILTLFILLAHYLFGHKILTHLRRAFAIVKAEEIAEEKNRVEPEIKN